MTDPQETEVCCPPFDPQPWQDKIIEWNEKSFLKGRVFTFFYLPMNFGSVMSRLNTLAESQGARAGGITLADHTSKWNMDLLCETDRRIPNAEMVTISGRFFTKAYEGEYREIGSWLKDFNETAKTRGLPLKKLGS